MFGCGGSWENISQAANTQKERNNKEKEKTWVSEIDLFFFKDPTFIKYNYFWCEYEHNRVLVLLLMNQTDVWRSHVWQKKKTRYVFCS